MTTLNAEQIAAAEALLAKRPHVLPGTRAILVRNDAVRWHSKVSEAMVVTGIQTPAEVKDFCDAAGVAS